MSAEVIDAAMAARQVQKELRGQEPSREPSTTPCDGQRSRDLKTNERAATVPAFPAPLHPQRGPVPPPKCKCKSKPKSKFGEALTREIEKRIKRHFGACQRSARRRKLRKTKDNGQPSRLPASWMVHPQFHPFLVHQRFATIEYTIAEKVRDGTYVPMPVLERRVPKPTGGTRVVTVLSVPDAAVSYMFYRSLVARYGHMLSSHAFAYRDDRGPAEAIAHLKRGIDEVGNAWTLEVDFEAYFDTISHSYLLTVLRDDIGLTKHEIALVTQILRTPRASSVEDYQAGRFWSPTRGIPQGSTLCLFLANIACWALDRKLERMTVAFSRFADDTTALCRTREDARRVKRTIQEHCDVAGLKINKDKSPGVRRFGKDDVLHYVGGRISRTGVGIAAKAVAKFKARVSTILHRYLHRNLLRAQRPWGTRARHAALLKAIVAIRRYVFGRSATEAQVRRVLSGGDPHGRAVRPLWHLSIVEGDGVLQLRELDGWLANVVDRAHREVCRALRALGVPVSPLSRAQLESGSWASTVEAKLSSLVLARKYLRRCGVPPSRSYT